MKRLIMLITYKRPFSIEKLEYKADFTVSETIINSIIELILNKFIHSEPNSTILSVECRVEDTK